MSSPDCVERDYLNMAKNKKILKMLAKNGNNQPMPEHVILSTKLWKINRKGKSQKRILLITNKAIYNIKPNKLNTCQRRIMLEAVASITSSKSDEFTINITSEYDYRYKPLNTTQKQHIIKTVTSLYGKITGLNLNVHNVLHTTTKAYTVTRIDAKQTSYADKYERRKILTHSNNIIFVDDDNTTPLLTATSVPITFIPTKKVTNTKIEYEYKEHSYKCNAMETTPQQENIENINQQVDGNYKRHKFKEEENNKLSDSLMSICRPNSEYMLSKDDMMIVFGLFGKIYH